jgi:glycosyltransferase involved in cell wall biosynthesis
LLDLKRVDLLISAFSATAAPEDRLTIIGDGPRRASLEKMAKSSSVRNQISFKQAVADGEAINTYTEHDVLVLPSNREVWGMVIPEALVLGLRVIASDKVGAAETFSSFSTFTSFKSGSSSDLAIKLNEIGKLQVLSSGEQKRLLDLNSPKVFVSNMEAALREKEGLLGSRVRKNL